MLLQYQLYNGRSVARQYTSATRADHFQHQLVSSILCQPSYQGMGSPAKHVTVVQQPPQLQIQPPPAILSQPQQQYVPVSMVEQSGRQMLLTVSGKPDWNLNSWGKRGDFLLHYRTKLPSIMLLVIQLVKS